MVNQMGMETSTMSTTVTFITMETSTTVIRITAIIFQQLEALDSN